MNKIPSDIFMSLLGTGPKGDWERICTVCQVLCNTVRFLSEKIDLSIIDFI